ncbi:MAG: twin-arginine translocase TatA/TatE family subunit [Flavisolibacter sp.]|nr:twin-arginine translocase TatA/TatE family subunit [Flavisolibacter sp.]
MLGIKEILIILVIILLLFGAKRIPQLMRGVGSGIREFTDARSRKSKDEVEEEEIREDVKN